MRIVYSKEEPIDRSDAGLDALRLVNSGKGAQHMTAGVATFSPGSAVFLHTHPCEETVISLKAGSHSQAKRRISRALLRRFTRANVRGLLLMGTGMCRPTPQSTQQRILPGNWTQQQ